MEMFLYTKIYMQIKLPLGKSCCGERSLKIDRKFNMTQTTLLMLEA